MTTASDRRREVVERTPSVVGRRSVAGARAKRQRRHRRFSTVVAMKGVAVIREGEGPEILLVHGGASPSTTWGPLAPLKARWTLAFVHRRGYPPSPQPPDGRQDFDVDAAELAPLLDARSEERRVGKECRARWSADDESRTQTE